MPLHIEMRKERSIMVVCLSGKVLQSDGAVALSESLTEQIDKGENQFILDVRRVVGMDRVGAETFLQMQAKAKQAGGGIKMLGARYTFIATIAFYDSAKALSYYSDAEDAVESFGGEDSRGVRHFDILEFVQQQEKESQQQGSTGSHGPEPGS